MIDTFPILNYQGSKRNLLEFIHDSLKDYITKDDIILDIFSGTCCVGYSYKKSNIVYANDSEKYAYTIASALLKGHITSDVINRFTNEMKKKIATLDFVNYISLEREYIINKKIENLINLYKEYPTVWNGKISIEPNKPNPDMFKNYYAASYFGIEQSAIIDFIREMITEKYQEHQDILFSALFYAMKECVFSKDGHMAQPLDLKKNSSKLINVRSKNILELFTNKCYEFTSNNFVKNNHDENKVFNCDFESLLEKDEIKEEVNVIYADPPYTDMQYSRYYHLLNTVLTGCNKEITLSKSKKTTKGMYLNNRFQSKLSRKSECMTSFEKLIKFSKEFNKTLIISFAYPKDSTIQKTDRYVMSIDEIIEKCKEYFEDKVIVKSIDYKHSNNRNSETKKVLEYLIICERG